MRRKPATYASARRARSSCATASGQIPRPASARLQPLRSAAPERKPSGRCAGSFERCRYRRTRRAKSADGPRMALDLAWLDSGGSRAAHGSERYGEIGIANFLAPALGNLPLVKLSPVHLQGAYNGWATGGRRDGK